MVEKLFAWVQVDARSFLSNQERIFWILCAVFLSYPLQLIFQDSYQHGSYFTEISSLYSVKSGQESRHWEEGVMAILSMINRLRNWRATTEFVLKSRSLTRPWHNSKTSNYCHHRHRWHLSLGSHRSWRHQTGSLEMLTCLYPQSEKPTEFQFQISRLP